MAKRKKKVEPLCKNCRLFDSANNLCKVVILYGGERINLPVEANDKCFFENEFTAITPEGVDCFKPEVQEVKFWVEDPKTGQKVAGDGVVKIQYPENFFGTPQDDPESLFGTD